LLGMYRVSSLEYITLIKRGESPLNDKIMNDVFRTCATDKLFSEKVSRNLIF
jgi:cell cycle arrest protein BUB2